MKSSDLGLWKDVADKLGIDTFEALDDFLGITEYHEYLKSPMVLDGPMPDDLRHLFHNLLGPHSRTILRVHRIKKGLIRCA